MQKCITQKVWSKNEAMIGAFSHQHTVQNFLFVKGFRNECSQNSAPLPTYTFSVSNYYLSVVKNGQKVYFLIEFPTTTVDVTFVCKVLEINTFQL